MPEENEAVAAEATKEKSKTDRYIDTVQAVVTETIGQKVSKDEAWKLFKALVRLPYKYILSEYEAAGKPAISYGAKIPSLSLPLSGVGTFKVKIVGKSKGARDANGKPLECSVKPGFYPSSTVEETIKVALGFATAAPATTAADAPTAPAASTGNTLL